MSLFVRLRTLLATLAITFAPALAFADEYVDFDPSKAQKSVSAPLYVVIAYSAIWLVVLIFAVMLYRRQQAIREELAQAQGRLDELTGAEAEKATSER